MRTLIFALGLALAACAAGGCTASDPTAHHRLFDHDQARSNRDARAKPKAPLSAKILLPSRTMTAGTSMTGKVVIVNNTGQAIHASGCGSLFQVNLVSARYHPEIFWTTCLQRFTIPTGRSSYPVTVDSIYHHCTQHGRSNDVPRCTTHGMPLLPPGSYRATFFQVRHLVPAPPAIPVRVTVR
jgi:hypothetical protein